MDTAESNEIPYSEDEINNLRQLFEIFDKDQTGKIDLSDMEQVMENLGKDPAEAQSILKEIDPENDNKVTFDQFLKMLAEMEKRLRSETPKIPPAELPTVQADAKVLDFLNLLEEYRAKCEGEGNYAEAKKAIQKYEELKKKETIRQLQSVRQAQEQELQEIEDAQNSQLSEFSKAWDEYMADYEATAYLSLEKLKERHILEYQEFRAKVIKEAEKKVKHSKELLEMRKKQQTLARQKLYEEAEGIKFKADELEAWENAKNEAIMKKYIEAKEKKLRQNQQLALAALLKRIERDRNEQIKHREMDSKRLMLRNKNIINTIISKQNGEAKKTLGQIKTMMGSDFKRMRSVSQN